MAPAGEEEEEEEEEKRHEEGDERRDSREEHVSREQRERDWRWPLRRHKEQGRADPCSKKELDLLGTSPLPFDVIVQHILVRLTLRELRKLCCVSKPWNDLLAWGSDAMNISHQYEEEYWFVTTPPSQSDHSIFRVISSHDGQQRPFLAPLLNRKAPSYLRRLCCINYFGERFCEPLVASAGGLMSALVHATGVSPFRVVVFNCLTGSVMVLPPPLSPDKLRPLYGDPCLIYRAVDDEDPSRYYVMLSKNMTLGICNLAYFEVFDSKTGRWKTGSTTIMGPSHGWKGSASGDFFHVQMDNGTMKVLAYNVDCDAWIIVEVPLELKPDCLHKYKGRLLAACLLEDDIKKRAFGVWELQITNSSETARWVEVSRTPEIVVQSMPRACGTVLNAEGGLFYTRSYGMDRPFTPLVYDISRNSWYVQPLEQGHNLVFVHRPRLSMYFW